MGKLREKMSADLTSPETKNSYLYCAKRFAVHCTRPPETLGEVEVQCFLLSASRRWDGSQRLKVFVASLKFLYEVTLERPEVTRRLVFPKVRSPLPDILSVSEVMRLLKAVDLPKYRALLTTARRGTGTGTA